MLLIRLLVKLVILLVLIAREVWGAPAPVPKRLPRKEPTPTLPTSCVMHWHGTPYRTEFRGDGSYRAEGQSGGPTWYGRWRLAWPKLVIEEGTCPHDEAAWRRYEIKLEQCLRVGALEGCERESFRLTTVGR